VIKVYKAVREVNVMGIPEIVIKIEEYLADEPRFFADIITMFASECSYRDLLLAWSDIREKNILKRDAEGHYFIDANNI